MSDTTEAMNARERVLRLASEEMNRTDENASVGGASFADYLTDIARYFETLTTDNGL